MPGKSCIVGLVIALSAAAAPAGDIKIHNWPSAFIPQEVTTIPVVMDVGLWVEIVKQDVTIKLHQINVHTYEGCIDLQVRTNFYLTLSTSIHATGAIKGVYTCWCNGANVDPPGGVTTICARLTDANLGGMPGGSTNVHVATVVVKVVPRS
jgi:hypothetical protein